jgi:nicotinamide riboside kinase
MADPIPEYADANRDQAGPSVDGDTEKIGSSGFESELDEEEVSGRLLQKSETHFVDDGRRKQAERKERTVETFQHLISSWLSSQPHDAPIYMLQERQLRRLWQTRTVLTP